MSDADGDPPAQQLASLRSVSRQSQSSRTQRESSPAQAGNRQPPSHSSTASSQFLSFNQRPSSLSQSQTQSFVPPHLREPPPANMGRSNPGTPMSSADPSPANLLNLLRFQSPASPSQPLPETSTAATAKPSYTQQSHPSAHSVHGRGISASDLVASSMGKPPTPQIPIARPTMMSSNASKPSSTNHQDLLLKLLNRSASTSSNTPQTQKPDSVGQLSHDLASASLQQEGSMGAGQSVNDVSLPGKQSPIRVFGGNEERETTPFEPPNISTAEALPKTTSRFTYVNPFEQLAASSPRNTKPKPPNGDVHKRKSKDPSPGPFPVSSRRKLTPGGHEIFESIELPDPVSGNDSRSRVEALMGIGAPTRDAETVAEALNDVGEKVDREVGEALAKAEAANESTQIKEEEDPMRDSDLEALEHEIHIVAQDVKAELDKDENKGLLQDVLSTPVAEVVNDALDAAAKDSADTGSEVMAEGEPRAPDQVVSVYQYPLRPFVSIEIKRLEQAKLIFRDDSITDIARLKKEFDQVDRTLATASNEFIAYGSPKTGGVKVIRQDDGAAKHLFSDTHDRVFNVSVSTASTTNKLRGTQTLLATGMSGTVYWTALANPEGDLFEEDWKDRSLIFPPATAQQENPSGGQLKTRVKKSSRHPAFFAIGRGRTIHVVFPTQALRSNIWKKGARMETEEYLKERQLKISIGKAGKDFVFSEDDSIIATLDKAGNLKFWDVRELVDEANESASRIAPIEVKSPVLTFNVASASEKSWPTSVLFVDRIRAYTKGVAQRYVLVGMKQNHTLQLWDLSLGKAIQELNLPHENESDAICSIAYNPTSGIIVVGHPTRNSVYFVHLSAPRYNLPAISQAKYVSRLAIKDSTLPKPDSTAIMSGMREYSFANKGQLRSIEMLPTSGELPRAVDETDPIVFELYVMYSKGVMSLCIKKEDLGLSEDSKVLHPIDAEKSGDIIVKELRLPQITMSGPSTGTPSAPATNPSRSPSKTLNLAAATPSSKHEHKKSETSGISEAKSLRSEQRGRDIVSDGAAKADKKKKKRNGAGAEDVAAATATGTPDALPSTKQPTDTVQDVGVAEAPIVDAARDQGLDHAMTNGETSAQRTSDLVLPTDLTAIEKALSAEFKEILNRELESLYRRFDEDKRVRDAAGAARQEAILHLVSSTLSENVEKNLNRIIQTNIRQIVLPSVTETTSDFVDKKISEVLTKELQRAVPTALKTALPDAIGRTMKNPETTTAMADNVAKTLASQVEMTMNDSINSIMWPNFQKITNSAVQKSNADSERRLGEQLREADARRRDDRAKIEQLTALVHQLSQTVHSMAASQAQFQDEILKLQQQAVDDRHHRTPGTSTESRRISMSPQEEETRSIMRLLSEGRYEDAVFQVISTPIPHIDDDAKSSEVASFRPRRFV